MNKYEHTTIHITEHAYQQYYDRVEPIYLSELERQCNEQLQNSDYDYNKKGWIHLSGVWWVIDLQGEEMTFVTCYGKTNLDMPRALAWAGVNRDRIVLGVEI